MKNILLAILSATYFGMPFDCLVSKVFVGTGFPIFLKALLSDIFFLFFTIVRETESLQPRQTADRFRQEGEGVEGLWRSASARHQEYEAVAAHRVGKRASERPCSYPNREQMCSSGTLRRRVSVATDHNPVSYRRYSGAEQLAPCYLS